MHGTMNIKFTKPHLVRGSIQISTVFNFCAVLQTVLFAFMHLWILICIHAENVGVSSYIKENT